MKKVFGKRIPRELRENFRRWFALFLMIALGMYIVTSIVGAAENIIVGSREHSEKNLVEDGEFTTFIPLTSEQEKRLSDMGVTLERKFSLDISCEDGSVLRVMKNRVGINLIDTDEERLAEKDGEIVLEKRYCEEHGYFVGGKINMAGQAFAVVGIGTSPDYDLPIRRFSDISAESALFGTAFVTSEQYAKLLAGGFQKNEDYTYAYRLGNGIADSDVRRAVKELDFDYEKVGDKFFREMISEILEKKKSFKNSVNELDEGAKALRGALAELAENGAELAQIAPEYIAGVSAAGGASERLAEGTGELKAETDKLLDEIFKLDIDNLTSFVTAAENPRILAAAGDMVMNRETGLLAGVVVAALFAYVISVFTVHQINRESSVIGTLYALGVKKKELLAHYATLPALVTFLGGLTGAVFGFSELGTAQQMRQSYAYFSIPVFDRVYPAYLIIYAAIMPPIISVIVNVFVIDRRLSQTALSLIRNERKRSRLYSVKLKGNKFARNFRIRQAMRELRTNAAVIVGMFVSLLVFMLGLNCYVLCENVKKDTADSAAYEYMYTLKYPEKSIPKDAEACYTESLSKTERGCTLDISLIGIDSGGKYFDAAPSDEKNGIVIGKSVASKYGLSKGEKLLLTDSANEKDYVFTVEDVCGYSVGLAVFMNIVGMRELFGRESGYYNTLLSDKPLDIDAGRLYSVTSRSDIIRSSAVFTEMMTPLTIMMISVSLIIFFMVMYLMTSVMISRSSFGISLIKIFGFRTKEIRSLYLNGGAVITAAGAVLCIPLAKIAIDAIYPRAVANVACGMNLGFKWYYYPLILAGIILMYFITAALLIRKINGITPAEVLKNRE